MLRLFFRLHLMTSQLFPQQFLLRQPADPRSLQCGSVFEMLKHFKEYAVCRPRCPVQYPSVNQIELDDSFQRRNAALATRRMIRGKETRKAWALSYVVCDGVFNPPVARWLQGNTLGIIGLYYPIDWGLLQYHPWSEMRLRDVDGFEHCSLEINIGTKDVNPCFGWTWSDHPTQQLTCKHVSLKNWLKLRMGAPLDPQRRSISYRSYRIMQFGRETLSHAQYEADMSHDYI